MPENKRTIALDWFGDYDFPNHAHVMEELHKKLPEILENSAYQKPALPASQWTIQDFLDHPDILAACLDRLPSPPRLTNDQIHIIAFLPSNRIGPETCRSNCSHCIFRSIPEYKIDIETAIEVVTSLKEQGYICTGLTPPDSFAPDLLAFGKRGSGTAYNITNLGFCAWTSGAEIAGHENPDHLLDTIYDTIGYREIIMNGQEVAGTPTPFTETTPSRVVKQAVDRIRQWNQSPRAKAKHLKILLTFTITKLNNQLKDMRRMLQFCRDNGIGAIRFNRFSNFANIDNLSKYEISREEITVFYENLATLHQEIPLDSDIKLSVSQDFGEQGITAIEPFMEKAYQNKKVNMCRLGRKLFSLVIVDGELTIACCTNRYLPKVGKVRKKPDSGMWEIQWDEALLKRIFYTRGIEIDGNYGLYGCWAAQPHDPAFNNKTLIESIF